MRRQQVSAKRLRQPVGGVLLDLLLRAARDSVWRTVSSVQTALILDDLLDGEDTATERGGTKDISATLFSQEVQHRPQPDG